MLLPGTVDTGLKHNQDAHTGALNHTGWLYILPFLDQTLLYNQIDLNLPTNGYVDGSLGGSASPVPLSSL